MASDFINKKYVKKMIIDQRDYQVNIAKSIKSQNSLVVLPTSLGKTVIALLTIADSMIDYPDKT